MKWYIGISIFAIIIIITTVFIVVNDISKINQLESDLSEIQYKNKDSDNINDLDSNKNNDNNTFSDIIDQSDDTDIQDHSDNLTQSEIDVLNKRIEMEGLIEENLSKSKVGVNWDLLTPDQQLKYDKEYYNRYGLDPPPLGYQYLMIAPGTPRTDKNGKPIIIKKGDVYISVRYGNGFAPTHEQYKRYQFLEKELNKARDVKIIANIRNQIDDLKNSAQGRIPTGATTAGGEGLSSSEIDLRIKDAINNAYIELGLSHLISSY